MDSIRVTSFRNCSAWKDRRSLIMNIVFYLIQTNCRFAFQNAVGARQNAVHETRPSVQSRPQASESVAVTLGARER